MSDLDDDFIRELKVGFCEEAKENLGNCEAYLLQYESTADAADMDALKRELHCLKGSSNAAGLPLFSKAVHSIENMCVGPQGVEIVSEMLEYVDKLREYVDMVVQNQEQEADNKLKTDLSSLVA